MDRITANLPSRDFDQTIRFYRALGFEVRFRDEGWLILARAGMEVEFFVHADLVPGDSWFSACIRVDDRDALQSTWRAEELPDDQMGRPRTMDMIGGDGAPRFFALIDCDGSLPRCIDNGSV